MLDSAGQKHQKWSDDWNAYPIATQEQKKNLSVEYRWCKFCFQNCINCFLCKDLDSVHIFTALKRQIREDSKSIVL